MRELKFRIWHKHSKQYLPTDSFHIFWLKGEIFRICIHEPCMDIPKNNVVIQQFSGERDKNGVDIYEGDIVRAVTVNDETEFYAPIVFSPHNGYYLDSQIERWDRNVYDGGVSVGPECELVGNIFENPELLEE